MSMPDAALLQGIREFIAREVAPNAEAVDRTGELPAGLFRKMGEHGLLGLSVPTQWGGVGADLATQLAAVEALGRACGSTAWAYLVHGSAMTAIQAFGSDAQKDRYLPALAEGRLVGAALAGTEAGGGSNHMAIRSLAREDTNGYVLDGNKSFISQAGAADVYVAMVRTGEGNAPSALSCFLLEKDDPGVSFPRREQTMGVRGVRIGEIVFDGVRLPADRLLGGVGGGLPVLQAIGGHGGLGAAAATLGLAQAALDATRAYVKTRTVLDKPLGEIGAVQARVAEAHIDLAGARALLEAAVAWRESGVKGPPVPAWTAKVATTEAALRVIERCMTLHGAMGYSSALPLERAYRDARAYSIHFGNNETARENIAKALLA
jgi:alkylation response protein AidB-like acyl-CoA dehydrogenase